MNRITVTLIAGLAIFSLGAVDANSQETSHGVENHDPAEQNSEDAHEHAADIDNAGSYGCMAPDTGGEDSHDHADKSVGDAHEHEAAVDDAESFGCMGMGTGHEHDTAGGDAASESCVTEGEQDCASLGAIADQLFEALRSGDTDTIHSMFAPDILIFESGNAETSLQEYAGQHMPADMAFLAAMDKMPISRQVIAGTDIAVVNSRSRLWGSYQGKDLDLFSTETLVLQQSDGVWRVVHVHWSSNP